MLTEAGTTCSAFKTNKKKSLSKGPFVKLENPINPSGVDSVDCLRSILSLPPPTSFLFPGLVLQGKSSLCFSEHQEEILIGLNPGFSISELLIFSFRVEAVLYSVDLAAFLASAY